MNVRAEQTARMTKCACGNVARFGALQCGRCREASAVAEAEERGADRLHIAVQALRNIVDSAEGTPFSGTGHACCVALARSALEVTDGD